MTLIQEKIRAFIKEAGPRERYDVEKQKIYSAFTKENGKDVGFSIVDCEGVNIKVKLESSKEVKKILLKHFQTDNGTVTAKDILNMFDVMRTGSKSFNNGNYVYSKRYVRRGNVYYTVIKLFSNGRDAVLKSFYSNIGYK